MSAPPDHSDGLLEILGPDGGVIDRDGLVRAIRAAGLPEILARQGAIDDAARARIEARLEVLLGSHDRRPTDADIRPASNGQETDLCRGGSKTEAGFAPADDTTVDAILLPSPRQGGRSRRGDHRRGGDANGDGNGKAGRHGSEDGRFTVLKPYKSGGLGLVSIARDEDLRREVAYKEIREVYANHPDKRARFVSEAAITGGLEHPGIVPVYALGRDAQGRPFYAMKFIRGKTLKEAVVEFRARKGPAASRREGLRDLIGRMVAVCDAVQYAHSRCVIHRDIKPTNIMIGKYGETLVVDWGLAKVFGRRGRPRPTVGPEPVSATGDSASSDEIPFELQTDTDEGETPPGKSVGTPGYMSPEQAKGADYDDTEEQIGPRTDVYSLGATLYFIFTGKNSIEDPDPIGYLRKLDAGDFPAPYSLDPTVPRALDAVCMKAMALDPADRYASPQALAADLKHWLADEPVSAYRDPFQARAFRWVRRHKPIVAGGLMFFIATIGVLGATLGAIVSASKRADENLARLAETTWGVVFELRSSDPMLFTGKSDQSRGRLDDQAEAVFDLYLRHHPDDRLALERSAIIAGDAADLHRIFAEEYPKARAQSDKAIRNLRRLVSEVPEDLRFQELLLKAYIGRIQLSFAEQRWDDVDADLKLVLGLTQEWPSWTYWRAWALQIQAKFLGDRGRHDDAAKAIDESIRLLSTSIIRPDGSRPAPRESLLLVLSESIRAWIAIERDKPEEARDAIQDGIRVLNSIDPSIQDELDARYVRACLLYIRASIDASTPAGLARAEAGFGEAVAISRRLVKDVPEKKVYEMTEARSLLGLSGVRLASNGSDLDVVESDLARVGTILDNMAVTPNKVAELDAEKARHLITLGLLDAGRGNLVDARKKITAGEAALAGLVRTNSLDPLVHRYHAFARNSLARVAPPSPPR
jgi:serine/threonine protein kinase/tetratricopeptide (TPR) repeat protein